MGKTRLAFAGLVAFGALFSISAMGCADDESTSDGGGAAGSNAGSGGDSGNGGNGDAGPDAYVWMPRDSGSGGSGSSGGSGGSTSTQDSGLDGRMCAEPRDPLPDVVLPRCRAATRDCIATCADAADPDACREVCIAADDLPAETTYGLSCAGCIYLQLFACIDATDCHDGVAELFCCIEDNCPTGSGDNCTEMQCPDELMTALTCGYFANQECVDLLGDAIAGCFEPGSDEDAGL